MSNPTKRTTERQVYDSGLLSSFTDAELKHITTSGANKPILEKTTWVEPVYVKNEAGRITGVSGYTIRFPNGTPGIKDGKPTYETMDYLIANAKKLNISDEELGVMIRERHGISTVYSDPASLGTEFRYGGGRLDFAKNKILKNYAYNQTAARKIVKEINNESLNVGSLVEQGILEQKEATKTKKNKITQEYGPTDFLKPEKTQILFDTRTGTRYNPFKKIAEIYQNESGGNDQSIAAIAKEVDHLASGYITRDPKDGSRVSVSGEISGGMALYSISVVPPDVDEGSSIVGVVKDNLKVVKIGAQAITWSAILGEGAIAVKLLPKESMLAHAIHGWMDFVEGPANSHGHHNPLANRLIAVKSLYGLLVGIKEGSAVSAAYGFAYPHVINLAIHKLGPKLAAALGGLGFRGVTSAGATLALDFLWLTWDLGKEVKAAIDAYNAKQEEINKLREAAIKNGWHVGTFIESNGTIALPAKIFYYNPTTGKFQKPIGTITVGGKTYDVPPDNTTPIEIPPIGYDKDGKPIFPSSQNINPDYIPRTPTGKPIINRSPLQSITPRGQFKFRPIQKDKLSNVVRTDDGNVYTALLNDNGTPTGYYQQVSVYGDAKEGVYASSINNIYAEQKQQNYLDNLLTYRATVDQKTNPASGPVLNSNGMPLEDPSVAKSREIDKERSLINALVNYDRWWVTESTMGDSNVSINTIPEPIESTGGEGGIMDSTLMPPELLAQTREDGDYYINSSHNTFRIYKGNAVIVNKRYQPYNRFG